MARVRIADGRVDVELSLPEEMFSFHGAFAIPLEHVTKAYASTLSDLQLRWRLFGTGAGTLMTGGIFTSPEGTTFCDVHGRQECLVIETRNEHFKRLAFTLDDGEDPESVAREISATL